jgi:hypothetical protein
LTETAFERWVTQPTTIHGIGAAVGSIAAVLANLLTKQTDIAAAAGAAAYTLVNLVLPDNTAADTSLEKLVKDTTEAVVTRQLRSSLPALFVDGQDVAQALEPAIIQTVDPPAPAVQAQPGGAGLAGEIPLSSPSAQEVAQ